MNAAASESISILQIGTLMPNYKSVLSLLLLLTVIVSCNQKELGSTHTPTVYVKNTDNGHTLIKDGKPFFVKGVGGYNHLKELKEIGGNTVRIYDTINLSAKLDRLDSLGLAAVVDLHLPRYRGEGDKLYADAAKVLRLKERIRKTITTHRNHPALLFWMLGNEVYYPTYFGNPFIEVFNDLLKTIHEEDLNHPVSTTVSSSGLRKLPIIWWKSSELDFLSINNFGSLPEFQERKKLLFFWSKPFLISEWGIHGPWESNLTSWDAPIEISSTQKANIYKDYYQKYIAPMNDPRFLGSMVFYWGQKQERTHTWFSLFTREGQKTQTVYELDHIWNRTHIPFKGVQIKSLEIGGKRAKENVILVAEDSYEAKVSLEKPLKNYRIKWEIKQENWNIMPHTIEEEPSNVLGPFLNNKENLSFKAPRQRGPYRLFVEIEDSNGYVATANVPFYVL